MLLDHCWSTPLREGPVADAVPLEAAVGEAVREKPTRATHCPAESLGTRKSTLLPSHGSSIKSPSLLKVLTLLPLMNVPRQVLFVVGILPLSGWSRQVADSK
jgi:hypothetical protein